jgi:hypothetical protein
VAKFIRLQLLVIAAALVGGCANTRLAFPAPGSDELKEIRARASEDNVTPQAFDRTPLPSTHPLVGVWRIELAGGKCAEEYELRTDGTKMSMSGEERNESEFMISQDASRTYWYKWVDRITKNNGKPDCMGSRTAVGHTAVNYVIVHPSGQRFALCEREDMNSCYAELFRQAR